MIAWHVVPTEKAASISKRINRGSIRSHTVGKRTANRSGRPSRDAPRRLQGAPGAREEEQARIKAEEEAQAAESARLEALRAKLGHPIESETLFSEAFPKWLDLYKSPPTRKPSTYASYLDTYRIHFAEAFGNLPLYQITQDVVQDYYQRKQRSGSRADGKNGGLSAKTIQNHHMLLKDFFTYAVKKYKLSENPTLDTARPTVITPEMRVLSPSEMQIFIEEVMRETQRVAILTTLFVGFRVGEVLALNISDLNLERQTLTVNKNLIRVPTAAISPDNPNIQILNYDPKKKTHLIVQNTPKTSTSNREIAISDGLCELLIRHLFTLANSTWPNPDGLLFPSKAGTHLDPKSFEIRLAAVSKRCEIRKVNPHAADAYAGNAAGGRQGTAQYRAGDSRALIHRDYA